jgi:hypothetical protein
LALTTIFGNFQIPVVMALDGVGKNLQDHLNAGADILQVTNPDDSLNVQMMGSPINIWNYYWSGSGRI